MFSTLNHRYQRYHRGSSDIPEYNSAACEISMTLWYAFILLNDSYDGGPLLGYSCCNIWLPNRLMRQKLLSEGIRLFLQTMPYQSPKPITQSVFNLSHSNQLEVCNSPHVLRPLLPLSLNGSYLSTVNLQGRSKSSPGGSD